MTKENLFKKSSEKASVYKKIVAKKIAWIFLAWHLVLSTIWFLFWWKDLGRAQAQVMLWVLPISASIGLLLRELSNRTISPLFNYLLSFFIGFILAWIGWDWLHHMSFSEPRIPVFFGSLKLVGKMFRLYGWSFWGFWSVFSFWLFLIIKNTKGRVLKDKQIDILDGVIVSLWFGWCFLFVYFWKRSSNGCTGVSVVYGQTLLITMLSLLGAFVMFCFVGSSCKKCIHR